MQSEQMPVQATLRTALSAADVEASWRSEICAACGKFKRANSSFCVSDFSALALPMRWQIRGPESVDAFNAALRHLQLHQTRRANMAEGDWPYRSQDELEAAGFRMVRLHFRCEVPQPGSERVPPHTCGAKISLWRTKNDKLIALDDRTYRPHRADCVDPEYFERKREEKAAQKASRRKRA
jgi:hypothetical protein